MTASEDPIGAELTRDAPAIARSRDWEDVVRRSRRRRPIRPAVVAAFAVVALVLGATALARTVVSGFDEWLTGEPGQPVSADDVARFRARNEASAAPFARKTAPRELVRVEYDGRTYRLMGFRTGAAACLELAGSDPDEGGDVSCVSASALERSGDLAVPLRVDAPLRETKPGEPPSGHASFGLVAAETRRVELVTRAGTRDADVGNGAFLSLSPGGREAAPTVRAFAVDAAGRRKRVLLAPSLRDGMDAYVTGLPVRGPDRLERTVRGGSVGWVLRREPRGEPVSAALRRLGDGAIAFGSFARVIQPDPDDFVRFTVGVRGGTRPELCFREISRGGIGGGCNSADVLFAARPFSGGWTYAGAGSQLVIASGLASDDVDRLILYLGNGERRAVALRDNVYFARVHRAELPARLVALDAGGRVVGLQTMRAM